MMKKIRICFVVLWCAALFAACDNTSSVFFDNGQTSLPMEALNGNGKKGSILNPEKSAYIYLALDEQQLPQLALFQNQWGGLSCHVGLSAPATENSEGKQKAAAEIPAQGQLALGFLYHSDLTDSGKLKSELSERPLVRCLTPLVDGTIPAGETITLSMAIPAESVRSFRGILLYSTVPAAIQSVGMGPLRVGFVSGSHGSNSSGDSACYFGSQGGLWDRSGAIAGFDFSSARADFAAALSAGQNYAPDGEFSGLPAAEPGKRELAAVVTLSLTELAAMPENSVQQPQVRFDLGGESIRLRRAPNQTSSTFHCDGLENPFGAFSVIEGREMVEGVVMSLVSAARRRDGTVVEPLVTDPGMIPLWSADTWRHEDYELFEWEQFPGVLFFDTADYKVQDDFFKRLAFFTEKTGYIGTLVGDRELEGQHGFNAHDYRSETLAAFFTLAQTSDFPLNEKELLLRDILLHNGIIKETASGYESGYGAAISLSQESPMYLRYTFVAHEGFHGIFFVDEEFRNRVAAVYENADPQSLRFLHRYFSTYASLNYNLDDAYLMHNEFMAYVMQQPVAGTGAYFADNLARRASMLRAEPELCAYVQATRGEGFVRASEELSRYVFGRWGMESGRVSLVGR